MVTFRDGGPGDHATETPGPGAEGGSRAAREPAVLVARELRVGWMRRPLLGGALAVVALVLAAFATVVVRGHYGWVFVGGPEYEAAFADVSGLGEGAHVRYAGLDVGRVRRVAIDAADPRRVVVTLRVRAGTPVRASTRATVVAVSAQAASYVNLRPGTPNAPALAAGARIPTAQGPTLEDVLTRMTTLLDRADTLVAAAAPLADPRVFAALASTVARVDTLATAAARGADRWGPELERVVRRTDDVLARTDRVVATLDSARPALAKAPAAMVDALDQSRALLADVRAGVDEGGGVRALMRDLTATSDRMARLTERLEREPLSVLRRRGNPPKPAGPALRE